MLYRQSMMNKIFFSACLLMAWSTGNAYAEVVFPGKAPGKAKVECSESKATLSNRMFAVSLNKSGSGVTFGGLRLSNGRKVIQEGSNLFTITLANGTSYESKDLKSSALEEVNLKGNEKSAKLSQRLPGKAVKCTFTTPDGALKITWQAELRDNSHYVRQIMDVQAQKSVEFANLRPLEYQVVMGGVPKLSGGTTHGKVVVNNLIFCGLETPMSQMNAPGGQDNEDEQAAWDPEFWDEGTFKAAFNVPGKLVSKYKEKDGPVVKGLKVAEGVLGFQTAGNCKVEFSGRLNVVGVQLFPEGSEELATEDIHPISKGNLYELNVPSTGKYTILIWVDTKTSDVSGSGKISYSLPLESTMDDNSTGSDAAVTGDWVRRATLKAGQSWNVSSVTGFFAPRQRRRSFLAYLERERAVPYRLFIHYNDWYEIGITCNNNQNPLQRNTEQRQLEVYEAWKREMIQKRKTPIDAFVIDDGWDDFNSLWDFHAGFPNGFSKLDKVLRGMKSGLGTWLGPVGGYGHAKACRLGFWNKNHPNNQIGNFQLSNKEYFDAFVGRCTQMVRDYEMRYFKFDGISAQFHAKGPGNLEDAEGILSVLRELRKARPDIFINTTVGTWSSPFWLHFADSLWRQENDFGTIGNVGDPRDRWMNYRDRLIHEVFVQRSPLYPINSVMTHGIIITKNGPPREMAKDPENCLKEIRTHVGCGTCLQELYVDRDLLDQENGRLWNELAEAIKWLRRNEDVLADIHWVGGDPWNKDTNEGDLYGWAAWSPTKCTLTFRNSANSDKTLRATLREILDIPPYVKTGTVELRSSFRGQRSLPGIVGKAIDIDEQLEITLKGLEVIVMEGTCTNHADEADDDEAGDSKKKKKKGKKKGKKKKKKSKK